MEGAVLVSCSVHGVLDHMTGGINAPLIKLEKKDTHCDGEVGNREISAVNVL